MFAGIAQSVEHVIGNDEVIGPNPIISSINKPLANRRGALFMDLFFRDGTDDKPPTISLNFVLFRAACSVALCATGTVTNPSYDAECALCEWRPFEDGGSKPLPYRRKRLPIKIADHCGMAAKQ